MHTDILFAITSQALDAGRIHQSLEWWHDINQLEGVECDEDGLALDENFELKPFPVTGQEIRLALLEMEHIGCVKVNMATGWWSITDLGREMIRNNVNKT